MNASLLLNWRKQYWEERPYESSAQRQLRRVRGIAAPIAVLIGLLLGLAAGGWMILAYTLAGIWVGVLLLWPDHGFLLLYCLLTVYPISRVITISLKPTQSLTITSLALIPKNATLDNYRELFTDQP
ncbi:MAG TPA: hypothetical protein VHP83_16890, partial [Aggregatilineaceae bacterium]|nr:hypothetical protein [Aggregatilineaceae bacterium]